MKKLMYSSAGLLLIALAFLAFNSFSALTLTGARLDLTEQKLYTISEGTERILGELDEPINLYFFYSDKAARDLPVLRNYAVRVEEMLKAYERAADGKIKLHIVDPEPFSEDEATHNDITPARFPWKCGAVRGNHRRFSRPCLAVRLAVAGPSDRDVDSRHGQGCPNARHIRIQVMHFWDTVIDRICGPACKH